MTPPRPRSLRRSWIGRVALLAAGSAVLLASGGLGGVAAASAPAATSPIQASTAMGHAPFGEYVTRLSFDVASIEPALVTAGGPTVLTIAGTMTNSGPEELTNLAYGRIITMRGEREEKKKFRTKVMEIVEGY